MKLLVVLALCVAASLAEKKINLEDIEKDNLRAEGETKSETVATEETKYPANSGVNQYDYQVKSNQYQAPASQSTTYTAPQQQSVKYSAQPEYNQGLKYYGGDVAYQTQQQDTFLPLNLPQQQYETVYQQQATLPQKSVPQSIYESTPAPQLVYQPEVVVGNQIQSIQQKAASEKYVQNINGKETLQYVNIPTSQLLSYYPNLAINQPSISKSQAQPLLHRLATQAAQKISIPVYTPSLAQSHLASSPKFSYRIQPQLVSYASKRPQQTQAIVSTQAPQEQAYATPAYVQPKQLAYTQAYFVQPQPQYVQAPAYSQPGSVYSQPASAYSQGNAASYADLYAQFPVTYVQDNSLSYGQGNQYSQYYTQPQQFYVPSSVADHLTKQIYLHQQQQQQQQQQNIPQTYVKAPAAPSTSFALPQQSAPQFFKGGATQLLPVSGGSGASHASHAQAQVASPEPRSLLESYTPSYLIAAQDSARYRERPIKLESGFLPSKANFVQTYKKRKSE